MTDASWTFPDELRLAITGEPWSSARLSVQPTRLTALEERFETSKLPDWPVYTPQDVSCAMATDAAPDTFALWTAPLKADMAKYCPGRTTLSRLLSTITSAGYFLVDALADADNHSTVIVLSRDKQLTSGTTSQFFINGQRFVLTFAAPGDVMRIKSLLSQNFYENYMLESISENYSGGSIIDVGANIGNHSVFFGSIVTNGVVHAVEGS